MQNLLEFDPKGKALTEVSDVIDAIYSKYAEEGVSAEDKKSLAAKYTELATHYNTESGIKAFNLHLNAAEAEANANTTAAPAATDGQPVRRKPKDLTDVEKAEIRAKLTEGKLKQTEIAKEYNVHPSTIADVKSNRI